jgi:hypothetical protein
VVALCNLSQIDIGTSDKPEALVRRSLLFQVFREQVGVHLRVKNVMPVFSLVSSSISLAAWDQTQMPRKQSWLVRNQRSRFLPCTLNLPRIKQAVFGPKGDDDALWLYALRLRIGVKPARAGERLNTGEVNMVAALAAQAGLQQFVAPFRVPQRGSGPRDRGI